MSESLARILYDSVNSRVAKFIDDSGDSLLAIVGKLRNAAGSIVNPATEDKQDDAITKLTSLDGKDFATQTTLATLATETKLELVRALLETIDADTSVLAGVDFATQTTLAAFKAAFDARDLATQTTLAAVLVDTGQIEALLTTIDVDTSNLDVLLSTRATEATLLSADGRLTTIDAVLDSIKDTDGIKKITDQLPAGTNEIGKVAQGTKAAGSGAWPQVIYDATGNAVGVVLDGAVYRLQADSKIAKGNDSDELVHLEALDTAAGEGRLKATIYTPDGDPVAFGAVSASIKDDYVKNGGSSDLLVDGSVTPVVFTYPADSTYDISLQSIRFTMVSNGITFGNDYFGATAGPLPNGLLIEIVTGGNLVTLYNIQKNEHFINFSSPAGWEWIVSNKDVMTSAYLIGGGVKLFAGTGDLIRVTVRDDIDTAGLYFECFVKGNLLTNV
jgi:hypothetical protein